MTALLIFIGVENVKIRIRIDFDSKLDWIQDLKTCKSYRKMKLWSNKAFPIITSFYFDQDNACLTDAERNFIFLFKYSETGSST